VGKLVVVKGDPVTGTDKHNVTATIMNTGDYTGVGDFTYNGSVTNQVSDFVQIAGTPVALVTSHSTLNPGEDVPPTGKHTGPQGKNFVPELPPSNVASAVIKDTPLGTGVPNAGAGSALLTVGGVKVLLNADKIDTCSGVDAKADSTVTAQGQNFVTSD
jgi:hypothetical protein